MKNQTYIQRGFTLLELVLVVSVLTLLAVIVVLVINPAERIREARDATRLSDVKAISASISLMESDVSGGVATFDYDGPKFALNDSCAGKANPRIFVSVPSDNGETAPAPPTGWEYAQVLGASVADADGGGWLPVDFVQNPNKPLERLPVDPINRFDEGLYYSYVCGGSFEVNAAVESDKFIGEITGDGGDNTSLFESGSTLTIAPERPVVVATNSAPTIGSIDHNPKPVVEGSDVTFAINWSDVDTSDTSVDIFVCKSASVTAGTGCDGGEWVSAPTSTGGMTNLSYTTTLSDVSSSPNSYQVYVCDDEPECSSVQSGEFVVDSAPIAGSETSLPDDSLVVDYTCAQPFLPYADSWSSDQAPPTDAVELVQCTASSSGTGGPTEDIVILDGYNFTNVSGTIDGIVVELDNVSIGADGVGGMQQFKVRLSSDGGYTHTSDICGTGDILDFSLLGTSFYCSGNGAAKTYDPGSGGLWGRTWSVGDINNLSVKIKATSADPLYELLRFDVAKVTVYYTP